MFSIYFLCMLIIESVNLTNKRFITHKNVYFNFRGNMSLSHDNRQKADRNSRVASKCEPFLEMKSIQPYPTKEEYIFAMKEDLSKWFNSIYSFPASSSAGVFNELNAINFLDELENGVLICLHANSIMKAAITRSYKFRHIDLKSAGIMNCAKFRLFSSENVSNDTLQEQSSSENLKKLLLISAMKRSQCGKFFGEYLLFKSPTIPKSLQARDNIVSFIKWCRHIAKVRECLMFEADDLIYRKNENNFILCLLEVARFGSQFGIEIPSSFRLREDRFRFDNQNYVSLFNVNNLGSLHLDQQRQHSKAIEAEVNVVVDEMNDAFLSKASENESEQQSLQPEEATKTSSLVTQLTLSNVTNKPKTQINIGKSSKVEEKENCPQDTNASYEISLDITTRKRPSENETKLISHVETKKEKKICIVSSYSQSEAFSTISNGLKPAFNLIDLTKLNCADEEKLKVGKFFYFFLVKDRKTPYLAPGTTLVF
jgi:hypothetical protein